MKINYLAYLDPHQHHGGGEAALRTVLDAGRERGHDFRFFTVSPQQLDKNTLFADPDLTFIADVFNCPKLLRRFPRDVLRKVIEGTRYIHFDNAYVDCCNLDYLPCSGDNTPRCPHKNTLDLVDNLRRREFGTACFGRDPLVRDLYAKSLANCFVSPLHRDTICSMLGLDADKAVIAKPFIDASLFFDRGQERDIKYLFVGALGEAKGLTALREEYADKDITLIGNTVDGRPPGFGNYVGPVPYEEMPDWFNRAEHFVFQPRWPEPQGRVVVEAALCGCTIIGKERVGALSFPFDIADPSNYENSAHDFWEEIEASAS